MALVLALTSLSADNATTAAAAVAPASPSSSIPLVSFASGADPKLKHKWEALNDPVMGGQSTSRVAVENDVLNFTGKCAIVPSLQAPGFITAVAGRGMLSFDKFVDVSSCTGLTVTAKDYAGGYKGYRISFGTAKPPGGKFFAQGFKANLHPTVGTFGSVSIPFTDFTDFWDDATGGMHPRRANRTHTRARYRPGPAPDASAAPLLGQTPSTRAPRTRSFAPTRRRSRT